MIITTGENVAGKEIKQVLGLVTGNTVRSKHLGKDIGAGFKTLVGGEIKAYTEMLQEAREDHRAAERAIVAVQSDFAPASQQQGGRRFAFPQCQTSQRVFLHPRIVGSGFRVSKSGSDRAGCAILRIDLSSVNTNLYGGGTPRKLYIFIFYVGRLCSITYLLGQNREIFTILCSDSPHPGGHWSPTTLAGARHRGTMGGLWAGAPF